MPPTRPLVEPLETRRLYAAIGFGRHVLTVTGGGRTANVVTVGLSADGTAVVATDAYQVGHGAVTSPAIVSKSFPLSGDIRLIRIRGGGAADTITVDQTNGSFTIPALISGGGGDDTITCGDEPDRVFGNAGSDSINGGGGNDQLFGGASADALVGGDGDDYLAGQGGHDLMQGDAGQDTLHDAAGPDTVFGGAGADVFQIHSLKREKANDFDKAEDKLRLIAAPGRFTNNDDDDGGLGDLFPISSFF